MGKISVDGNFGNKPENVSNNLFGYCPTKSPWCFKLPMFTDTWAWFPHLDKIVSGWHNEINKYGTIITEYNDDPIRTDEETIRDNKIKIITFGRENGKCIFKGVFKFIDEMDDKRAYYKRISDTYEW